LCDNIHLTKKHTYKARIGRKSVMMDKDYLRAEYREISDEAIAPRSLPKAKILWLCQRPQRDEGVNRLYRHIRSRGMDLHPADTLSVTSQQLADADLIFLDALGQVEGMVETVVSRIRLESRVPLVMLTDGHSTEQLVTALAAGADAIWSLNMPLEVLMARCEALLRRWKQS
jgi:DNA-binding NarL/FixJ family response regulator